jgi:copper transport protein
MALLGVGFALALSGHASNAAPQWLTRPSVFVHVVCVTFWVGTCCR